MPVCPAGRSERRQKKRAGNCPFQSGRGPSRWSAGLGGKNFSLSIKRSGRVVKRITDEVRQHAFADHSCNYTTRLAFLPASKPHIALTPFSSPPPLPLFNSLPTKASVSAASSPSSIPAGALLVSICQQLSKLWSKRTRRFLSRPASLTWHGRGSDDVRSETAAGRSALLHWRHHWHRSVRHVQLRIV